MFKFDKINIGIYEKALPKDITWIERIKIAKHAEYDFIEISIDETDERISRLDWTKEERVSLKKALIENDFRIPSMCFSAHRRYPLGSKDKATQNKALELMQKAILLADDLGIRVIQMAGYDVYYEQGDEETKKLFIINLKKSLDWAAQAGIILAIEIMDHPFINSITKFEDISKQINSPWLKVYPDIGNLSAWSENDVYKELELGMKNKDIVMIHLKDTLKVTGEFPGKFKEVPFGDGCVDFAKAFNDLNILEYKGPFLIEMWTEKSSDPIEEIKKARRWIIDKMKKGGII